MDTLGFSFIDILLAAITCVRMTKYLDSFLNFMKPAFSHNATFIWFAIAFAGLITKNDSLGITSIIRALMINNRIVIVGDHTKALKDGRKMPALTTLHQDSESASKPSFFRGHEWGYIALLIHGCMVPN